MGWLDWVGGKRAFRILLFLFLSFGSLLWLLPIIPHFFFFFFLFLARRLLGHGFLACSRKGWMVSNGSRTWWDGNGTGKGNDKQAMPCFLRI